MHSISFLCFWIFLLLILRFLFAVPLILLFYRLYWIALPRALPHRMYAFAKYSPDRQILLLATLFIPKHQPLTLISRSSPFSVNPKTYFFVVIVCFGSAKCPILTTCVWNNKKEKKWMFVYFYFVGVIFGDHLNEIFWKFFFLRLLM